MEQLDVDGAGKLAVGVPGHDLAGAAGERAFDEGVELKRREATRLVIVPAVVPALLAVVDDAGHPLEIANDVCLHGVLPW